MANADPLDRTAFNTLSNVYVTAIERSTPVESTPVTAINLRQPPKLRTDSATLNHQQRVQTPYTAKYPDTPVSADPMSPAPQMDCQLPSTMTATPPLSAGPIDPSQNKPFSFAPFEVNNQLSGATSPLSGRRRAMFASLDSIRASAPYCRNRSLHSILRNSPLPPPTAALSPSSPRRQSLRLQEKAARRVGYESPLTETITTEKYTRSHIDLLVEEASPYTPSPAIEDSVKVLDLAMAYTGDETRDGGQTPGPFEEMRRRMTGLGMETPVSSPRPTGIRKKKRKDKKRNWVWTIGIKDDDESESGALAALKAASGGSSTPRANRRSSKSETPEPITAVKISVEAPESVSDSTGDDMDIEMSDVSDVDSSRLSSRATTPHSVDLDMKTPTVPVAPGSRASPAAKSLRFSSVSSVDSIDPATGNRRDTPIPPDLVHATQ